MLDLNRFTPVGITIRESLPHGKAAMCIVVAQEDSESAKHLVNVLVRVTNGQKRENDLLKNTTVDK